VLIIWGIFLTFFGFKYGQDMLGKITILGNNLSILWLFSNHFWDKEHDKDVPHIINILLQFFGFKYGIVHPVSLSFHYFLHLFGVVEAPESKWTRY